MKWLIAGLLIASPAAARRTHAAVRQRRSDPCDYPGAGRSHRPQGGDLDRSAVRDPASCRAGRNPRHPFIGERPIAADRRHLRIPAASRRNGPTARCHVAVRGPAAAKAGHSLQVQLRSSAACAARIFGLSHLQPDQPDELSSAACDSRLCRAQRQGLDQPLGFFHRASGRGRAAQWAYRGKGRRPHPGVAAGAAPGRARCAIPIYGWQPRLVDASRTEGRGLLPQFALACRTGR